MDDLSNGTAPIKGTRYVVNKLLAQRVNKLIADAPDDIRPDLEHAITSGYRTHAEQAAAYLHHLEGGGLAAPPGHSWHERLGGMAVDWNRVTPRAWTYLRANAGKYGLGFPLGSADPYHMQVVESYVGKAALHHQPALIANLVRHFESSDNYNTAYGGQDISNAPHDEYGFPIWAGAKGPRGMTHAAGAYGFEPSTWARYARKLGIKDFSKASQDRVFDAAYAAEGLTPWQSNTKLMAMIGRPGSPAPFAFDDLSAAYGTPSGSGLPIKPIAPVPMPGSGDAESSGLGRLITTKPMPDEPIPPTPELRAPHIRVPEGNLASGFRSALGRILRTR